MGTYLHDSSLKSHGETRENVYTYIYVCTVKQYTCHALHQFMSTKNENIPRRVKQPKSWHFHLHISTTAVLFASINSQRILFIKYQTSAEFYFLSKCSAGRKRTRTNGEKLYILKIYLICIFNKHFYQAFLLLQDRDNDSAQLV